MNATLDTGFSGFLTLPPTIVEALTLPFQELSTLEMADGTEMTFRLHTGVVEWVNERRSVYIHATEGVCLLGMATLDGCDVRIQVRDGGAVSIEPEM